MRKRLSYKKTTPLAGFVVELTVSLTFTRFARVILSYSSEDLDESTAYDVFLAQVEEMSLNKMETAALRLCVTRNDPALQAALEAYRSSSDGEDLQDSLRRIIKVTLKEVARQQAGEVAEVPAPLPVATANGTDDGSVEEVSYHIYTSF